jgi:hypothetical protein
VKFKKLRKEAVAHSSVKKLKTTSTAKKPMVQGKVNLPAKILQLKNAHKCKRDK